MSLDLPTLLPWGKPKRLPTSRGERLLRSAKLAPESPFWALWREHRAELVSAGIAVREWPPESHNYQANWWAEVPAETLAAEAEARKASHATEADLEVPAPEGLSYLPFQKAGIAFCLNRFKTLKEKGIPSHGALIADAMGL